MNEDVYYLIALTFVSNIGTGIGKKLLVHIGNAKDVFKENVKVLKAIPGIGDSVANSLKSTKMAFAMAEKEVNYVMKNSIRVTSFVDKEYPERLKQCADSPILYYWKGNKEPNMDKMLAVVGTRNATDYGRLMTENIISGLKEYNIGIVSGLAYGIDTAAHKSALSDSLPTFAVLGHGFSTIYPNTNYELSKKIEANGALITEFPSDTMPNKENFPKRNRIIAGLSDAILIIEAAQKGGALITADIAHSYNKDVFAVPGRVTDIYSAGCNDLIKRQKAYVVHSAADIIENMNWDKMLAVSGMQKKLFFDLTEHQQTIVDIVENESVCDMDTISYKLKIPINRLAFDLLDLELKGIIKCLPGKKYAML
ncbi:MAG: DNA-processing protein DprA [Bacteroidales bacterium]|jgi:DNA processing protein|nr:DNA-processing protein DprA [Bacteroidales bacterium]